MPPIVHIVDDDAQVRAATSYLLASHGYATEIYASGAELLGEGNLARGCILLDLRMPGMSGHEVQEELNRRAVPLSVVVMSGHGDLPAAVRSMKLGAADFLEKPMREEILLAAIDRAIALSGKEDAEARARRDAAAGVGRLSPRERQVLQGLLGGLSNKEIARRLELSPRTIEMHRSNMMAELGITSLPDAIRLAIDADLRPLGAEEGG